jgi:hypothetical protein
MAVDIEFNTTINIHSKNKIKFPYIGFRISPLKPNGNHFL